MNNTDLLLLLEQKIQYLYNHSNIHKDQQIKAKFDRTLFSESFETFGFYINEIEETLSRLKLLKNDEKEQYQFYCQKLVSQCSVLNEAIYRSSSSSNKKQQVRSRKMNTSKREKLIKEINQLPPRERLEKYYEALNSLNQKIVEEEIMLYQASTLEEKQICSEKIKITQQRKCKCLEAIELLEEYLAFRKGLDE
ncbi:restart primosome assembly protein PriC [Bisgaardia hudsonensis]|uniref:Restart primosome assembly protein PriC n=1 Tax=Bisgaardia hudsonensis TaxID=109472 RepID=A0A4R2N0M1_9PAST|nr:primosomal replication protein PriC [Bisgaardia hudsonensis]QLB13511.1 hypothetical protein A6A11_07775 [Bisgaardia hudsonensis]TCP12925.1 restart primosome assembly protein PriC [Bisgaardia hudsonensis]